MQSLALLPRIIVVSRILAPGSSRWLVAFQLAFPRATAQKSLPQFFAFHLFGSFRSRRLVCSRKTGAERPSSSILGPRHHSWPLPPSASACQTAPMHRPSLVWRPAPPIAAVGSTPAPKPTPAPA